MNVLINILFECIDKHFKKVAKLLDFDKFISLMSQEDPLCILKVAKSLQKANDVRQKEIQLQLLNKQDIQQRKNVKYCSLSSDKFTA